MYNWSFDPLEAARGLAGPPGDEPSWRAVDFAGIASWVVDGMHYLHDLDPFNLPDDRVAGYQVAQRQLAHARWAVGDAITAVDLCAAALGRLFGNYPKGTHEMDLRSAEEQLLAHPVAGPWISEIVSDPDYKCVQYPRGSRSSRRLWRQRTASGLTKERLDMARRKLAGDRCSRRWPTARQVPSSSRSCARTCAPA